GRAQFWPEPSACAAVRARSWAGRPATRATARSPAWSWVSRPASSPFTAGSRATSRDERDPVDAAAGSRPPGAHARRSGSRRARAARLPRRRLPARRLARRVLQRGEDRMSGLPAAGTFNPANEFELKQWVSIHLGPLDMSINKAVVYLAISALLTIALGLFTMRSRLALLPGK